MARPITIFISYAHKDNSYLQELLQFLRPIIREREVIIWTDKNIIAGQQWNEVIKRNLNNSEVILFLVSPDFLASDYINDTEIAGAIQRQDAMVIPVIIRPIVMNLLKIKYLQAIPTGAKAVSDWEKRDDAWNDVIQALMSVFNQIKSQRPEDAPKGVEAVSMASRTSVFTDKLVKWLLALLVTVSVAVFIYGMVKTSGFHVSTALAGICIGVGGYRVSRKWSFANLA